MATTNKEPIFIQNNNERIELKGIELEQFLADRLNLQEQTNTIESARLEREAKLESALNKLKSLGLTESEAKIIIGLE